MKPMNRLLMMAVSAVIFTALSVLCLGQTSVPASPGVASPDNIGGKVEGGGGPIAKATVTLWAAGPGAPQKLAERRQRTESRDHIDGHIGDNAAEARDDQ
jgi:hypothetical protein